MPKRKVKRPRRISMPVRSQAEPPRTLVVDIGASGIKCTLLNDLSRPVGQRVRRDTPPSGMPEERHGCAGGAFEAT